jgi:hypothetical protein
MLQMAHMKALAVYIWDKSHSQTTGSDSHQRQPYCLAEVDGVVLM